MKTRKYAIITGIIILLMCLSGCKSNKYDKSGVKVVFELEGGTYQNSTLPLFIITILKPTKTISLLTRRQLLIKQLPDLTTI